MTRREAIEKRKQCVGRRIRLLDIAIGVIDDYVMKKRIGQTGTVVEVDDEGGMLIDWDKDGISGIRVLLEDTVEFLDE